MARRRSAAVVVGVRELKANLSRYLAKVRQGETVIVTIHGKPAAEFTPPLPSNPEARYARLVAEGRVKPAARQSPRAWTRWKGLGLPRTYLKRILAEDREDRF